MASATPAGTPPVIPNTSVPAVDPATGLLTTPWFAYFQAFSLYAQGAISADEADVQALQVQQANLSAQLVLVNKALATAAAANASANPSSGNEQTKSGQVDLTTTSLWQNGPVVSFTSTASPVAVTVTSGSSCGPTTPGATSGINNMTGSARLQRIIGGVETTLATGSFTISPATAAHGGDPATPATLSWAGFGYSASYTPPASTTVSYRVDLERLSGCTSTGVSVVTDVKWM